MEISHKFDKVKDEYLREVLQQLSEYETLSSLERTALYNKYKLGDRSVLKKLQESFYGDICDMVLNNSADDDEISRKLEVALEYIVERFCNLPVCYRSVSYHVLDQLSKRIDGITDDISVDSLDQMNNQNEYGRFIDSSGELALLPEDYSLEEIEFDSYLDDYFSGVDPKDLEVMKKLILGTKGIDLDSLKAFANVSEGYEGNIVNHSFTVLRKKLQDIYLKKLNDLCSKYQIYKGKVRYRGFVGSGHEFTINLVHSFNNVRCSSFSGLYRKVEKAIQQGGNKSGILIIEHFTTADEKSCDVLNSNNLTDFRLLMNEKDRIKFDVVNKLCHSIVSVNGRSLTDGMLDSILCNDNKREKFLSALDGKLQTNGYYCDKLNICFDTGKKMVKR